MINLPEGYSVRPIRLDDAEALLIPNLHMDRQFIGEPEITLEMLKRDLQPPGVNLETDSLVVWAPDGKTCAGYVLVNATPPYVRNFVSGLTHQEHAGKGIGTSLFSWGLARARKAVTLAEAGRRVVALGSCYANDEDALQLLRDQGLTLVRRFHEMRIEMERAPDVPTLPDGFTIRTMNLENDVEDLYLAVYDAFLDH